MQSPVASGFDVTYIVGSVNTLPLTWDVATTRENSPVGAST